jgi:hypothetical protein
MNIYEVRSKLDNGEVEKLSKGLENSQKNLLISMYRDYYSGRQWRFTSMIGFSQYDSNGRSNTTRSGKVMWEITKGSNNPRDFGFTRGELKTWNVCDVAIDVYTSYLLGNNQEKPRVRVEGSSELEKELNDSIDLAKVLKKTTHRMCIDSVTVWKYKEGGLLEFIDSLEYFPIYDGDDKVGSLRMYSVNPNDPILEGAKVDRRKKYHTYVELWIEEEGVMQFRKFVDGDEFESGVAPYDFDPYIVVNNKDDEFVNFDENNVEISDVGKIIDVQDDLNSTITDISLINRKVAIPMFKIAQEVYNKVLSGEIDGEKFKQSLEQLTLSANKILSAPIEKMETDGLPPSTMQFVDSIFNQFYMITGIPKNIFVSEGVGNIAQQTAKILLESLSRRVDEKRANIEIAYREYVKRYLINEKGMGQEDNISKVLESVTIDFPEMVGDDVLQQMQILMDARKSDILPERYTVEKLLEYLGDSENILSILGEKSESNIEFRVEVEKQRLKQELDKEVEASKEETRKAQTEKSLLEKEIQNLISEED